MARKYLYFENSTADAILVNVDHLATIDIVDADTIQFYFRSNDAVDFSGSVLVDITSGYCQQFLKALTEHIHSSREPFIVVADDTSSKYFTTASSGTTVAATSCGTIALS
tara:strand:+ start:28535 stop:28864 length:330 start_codon:yes stop_codon:yes gene_type:complete